MIDLIEQRIQALNEKNIGKGPVIYWMQRDQRAIDNWALLFAINQAETINQPIIVVFCLLKEFLGAPNRMFEFMLAGLKETWEYLATKDIPMLILDGANDQSLVQLSEKINAGVIVTDFNPIKPINKWKIAVSEKINCRMIQVDAHNIVPCTVASDKQEYSARTFRIKINKMLPLWLNEYTPIKFSSKRQSEFFRLLKESSHFLGNENNMNSENKFDDQIGKIADIYTQTRELLNEYKSKKDLGFLVKPGYKNAQKIFGQFINQRLPEYHLRNDPNANVVSFMSAYLHFGQISAQRLALDIFKEKKANAGNSEKCLDYLEQLIIRRELSDNFCCYNSDYDNVNCFPDWAKRSHARHANDLRPYKYTLSQLENAETHDALWNAAQKNMVKTGNMPGYLRMYWAKKILEWTNNSEESQTICIYLNDKYMLDGRDPNGYAGIAWSIGGVHDRPWIDRPIFGQIRLMTLSGCYRKFDVDNWIKNNS